MLHIVAKNWHQIFLTGFWMYFCFVTIKLLKVSTSWVISVSRLEEIWGRFQLGSDLLSSVPAKFYWFILFCTLIKPLLFSCISCSFEQNTMKLIVYLRKLSENSNFLFIFFIFGEIFLVPITFERYHFQSGCSPEYFILSRLYLFKVNQRNIRTMCEIFSKLTIETA